VSYYDYILVGSGIAGLYTALLAKEQGSVLILTKSGIEECNTRHAQGGIAAPIGLNDSPELHIKIRWRPVKVCVMKKRCASWPPKPRIESPIL